MAKLLIVGGTGFFGKSILTYLSNNRLRKKFELIYILSKKKKIKVVQVSSKYFRPNELFSLKGNSSLAKSKLGFKPKHDINSLISEMMSFDLKKKN